jgi:hypothetical protein
MRNKISPPSHSLCRRNFKQIKIYSDPKRNNNSLVNKSFMKTVTEICNNIYEDNFPNILKINKIIFLIILIKKLMKFLCPANIKILKILK